MNNQPIGVFDSGVGGLTVLENLQGYFPNERFIYVGDTARVPYGSMRGEDVLKYSIEIVEWLLKHDVKAIVVACNTVSCLCLEYLKQHYNIPIFGMIDAGVETIVDFQRSKDVPQLVGIIGTKNTINSNRYNKELESEGFSGTLTYSSCPLFVPVIEEGIKNDSVWSAIIDFHLHEMKSNKLNAILLACTHYPIIINYLQQYLGNSVEVLNPNRTLCKQIELFLSETDLLKGGGVLGETELNVTGSESSFFEFLNSYLNYKHDKINIIHLE
ncbi:MAG: glutamate racemase [bacterium]|nr:glutamate racemase [bacterium]